MSCALDNVSAAGKGASATVYLAQYKDTETVAVKLIRMEDEEKDLELFKKELIIMRSALSSDPSFLIRFSHHFVAC